MSLIDKLLSQSPFSILKEMMRKIDSVVVKVPELFELLKEQNKDKLQILSEEISKQEGEIDVLKREIRKSISKTIFSPIPKRDFLDLILTMDSIPDRVESLAKIFQLRKISYPTEIENNVNSILNLNKEIYKILSNMIFNEVENLLESSFSSKETEKVIEMIEDISNKSYKLELLIQKAKRAIFKSEDQLHSSEVVLWIKILEQLQHITHSQEKTANTLLRIIEQ